MKKIMVVEDEMIIAMSYTAELRNASFEVPKTVCTGEEAVKIFSVINPDLILMDITLKGKIDGIEAANQILKVKKVPLIFMTGNSDIETKNRALAINPAGYMNKPINLNKMIYKIKKLLI